MITHGTATKTCGDGLELDDDDDDDDDDDAAAAADEVVVVVIVVAFSLAVTLRIR